MVPGYNFRNRVQEKVQKGNGKNRTSICRQSNSRIYKFPPSTNTDRIPTASSLANQKEENRWM